MLIIQISVLCTFLIGLIQCRSSNSDSKLIIDAFELTPAEYIDRHDSPFPFDDIVSKVNSMDTTWKAEIPKRFMYHSEKDLINFIDCAKEDPNFKYLPKAPEYFWEIAVPDEFDARTNWPNCKDIIGLIRDQSNCGSCWAFGAAEAMSDRICIKSMAQTKVNISAEDINDCCKSCGDGCEGGFPVAAWQFYAEEGVVTGGNYGSHSGCKPYSLPSCEHHISVPDKQNCSSHIARTPRCRKECSNTDYAKSYEQDKHKGNRPESIEGVENIQTQIMTYGPVEASFNVYADFPAYKSGVYQKTSDHMLGGHAVKILGWGVESTTPYWLVANSWNPDWGDKGYFKIIRGQNECGIEGGIVASIPI